MIQFKVLSGKKAGTQWAARRFPVQIGRAPDADLVLEEDGVFDRHALVRFSAAAGFTLEAQGEALAAVNAEPAREVVLRNGDIIDLGSARLQFWLAETRPQALAVREALAWVVAGVVLAAEVGLLYWLLQF